MMTPNEELAYRRTTMTLIRIYLIVVLGIVCIGLFGCVPGPQTFVTPLGTKTYAPIMTPVAVYVTDMPRCPYVEVASVTVTAVAVRGNSAESVRRQLTTKAASLGANGIIRFAQDISNTSPTVITQRGTAIRFTLMACQQ